MTRFCIPELMDAERSPAAPTAGRRAIINRASRCQPTHHRPESYAAFAIPRPARPAPTCGHSPGPVFRIPSSLLATGTANNGPVTVDIAEAADDDDHQDGPR